MVCLPALSSQTEHTALRSLMKPCSHRVQNIKDDAATRDIAVVTQDQCVLITTRSTFGLQELGIVFTRPEPSVGPSNRFGQGLASPPRAMLTASRITLTVKH